MSCCSRLLSWDLLIVPFDTPVVSQVGSWLCQHSVCPRTSWLLAFAKAIRLSAPLQSNVPCVGSTTCHFISLPGVTTENWLAATAAHAGVLMSCGMIALPTRRPIAAARSRSESLAGAGAPGALPDGA